MRGNVKQLPNGDKPGVIRGRDNYDYSFTSEDVRIDSGSLEIGREADFKNFFSGGKRLARKIYPIVVAQPEGQRARPRRHQIPTRESGSQNTAHISPSASSGSRNGFVNPYNFVPLSGTVGRGTPASHEYFINNTGRIVCKLKLKTPFFTPHPERRFRLPDAASKIAKLPTWISDDDSAEVAWRNLVNRNAEQKHEMLGLLKDESDRPFIPGASLKGAFRSVAEALSNSCLGVIDFQWELQERTPDEKDWIEQATNYFSRRIVYKPYERLGGRIEGVPSSGGKGKIDFSDGSIGFGPIIESKYNRANEAAIGSGKRHQLRVNDSVYFTRSEDTVKDMGPVKVYRVLYHHSLDEILWRRHSDFLTCCRANELCPSCRIFGWVHPNPEDNARDIAHKGFIHFGMATLDDCQKIESKWVTLKPLGQPRASSWQFYLNAKDSGDKAGYNDRNATVRGRKFYWHHPRANIDSVRDKRRIDGARPQPPDDQNKTVELLLHRTKNDAEVAFTFTVDFENLSDADLGLLLLTLQPNLLGEGSAPSMQLYHHFGMGKPLGFGSAEVIIERLSLTDRVRRYQSLVDSGETLSADIIAQPDKVQNLIDAFIREALSDQPQLSGNDKKRQSFAQMEHIETLLLMLDWAKSPKEVRYPPGAKRQSTKEYWESFRWFAHGNQRSPKPKDMLHTPRQIQGGKQQDGFPPME